MSDPIKIRIQGNGGEHDAPSIEDFLKQVGDLLAILMDVEEVIADEPQGAIVWRITDAHKNSPLELEVTPFAKQYAVNITQRADLVRSSVAEGLAQLAIGGGRPPYFTEDTLARVERLAERVLNGLAQTEVDFGNGLPVFTLLPTQARATVQNVQGILKPVDRPYEERGSVEGYFAGFERDGFGRGVLSIRNRLSGDVIKCIVSDSALGDVGEERLRSIIDRRRVRASGRIFYRSLGRIKEVSAERIRMLRDDSVLPRLIDIQDPEFTGGLLTEEYLERLRDGRPS